MRIIHTSDWHLGQHFIGKSRAAEHQAFIDWLLTQIQEQHIDAVIIAGDIFDTGTPPSYARKLYNDFALKISQLNCQLIVLGGNHDSVSMLDESKHLLAALNTRVIAKVQADLNDQICVLNNRNGEPAAVLCAIPFIRPRDVLSSQAGESGSDKQQALSQAITGHYQTLFDLAKKRRDSLKRAIPIIATGHLTAMGVKASESERDIYIGSLQAFNANGFPDADYIALGHIHRPQIVAKSEHIRYCGSPIPLSFDELVSKKQVLMVEFDQGKLSGITPLLVPRFQPMQTIKGDLARIRQQLSDLDNPTQTLPTWLSIEVASKDFLGDLQQRIQDMTDGLNVEVLQLRRAKTAHPVQLTQQFRETLDELTEDDVFERRLALETFDTEEALQRRTRLVNTFRTIANAVKTGGEA